MRVVLQRVSRAAVRVDGATVGAIGRGFVVLAGFAPTDGEATLAWMAEKIAGLRLFSDTEGKMNLPLADVGGGRRSSTRRRPWWRSRSTSGSSRCSASGAYRWRRAASGR